MALILHSRILLLDNKNKNNNNNYNFVQGIAPSLPPPFKQKWLVKQKANNKALRSM